MFRGPAQLVPCVRGWALEAQRDCPQGVPQNSVVTPLGIMRPPLPQGWQELSPRWQSGRPAGLGLGAIAGPSRWDMGTCLCPPGEP